MELSTSVKIHRILMLKEIKDFLNRKTFENRRFSMLQIKDLQNFSFAGDKHEMFVSFYFDTTKFLKNIFGVTKIFYFGTTKISERNFWRFIACTNVQNAEL